jgi:hypothetical protein
MKKNRASQPLFWALCGTVLITLLLTACGKDESKKSDPVQACGYNQVWVDGRGCLQQCYNRPGMGFDPQTGACLQGYITNCGYNQVWVEEYQACFAQCYGMPGYGYIPEENSCRAGVAGTIQTYSY